MFSNGDEVSSKRFSAFFTLLNIIILAYIATFMSEEKITPEFMYDALALIAGGGLGLTVIEKIFSKKDKDADATQDNTGSDQTSQTCSCGTNPGECTNCTSKNK
jgi:lipoprotein signal peptidase